MNMRFRDRTEAGRLLAEKLRPYAIDASAVVVGLPRGGVVTAAVVANALDLPLDVIVVRKLGTPWQPELALGAIASGGVRVTNKQVVDALSISESRIDEIANRERVELERREKLFRGDMPALALGGRTVIVVDDGIATGSTMRAAIRCIRAQRPMRIVLAVPVAPPSVWKKFQGEVDDLICLSMPPSFNSVGEWYDEFAQVSDAEVIDLMKHAPALA